jgi:hypothetical protein
MYVYRFEKKILCYDCFKRIAQREPEFKDVIDGNEFFRMFENRPVECDGRCGETFNYQNIFTSTDASLK